MSIYEEITEARKTLDLPKSATMEEIKRNYRTLIRKWHPDTCDEDNDRCAEMTKRLTAAYQTLISYCRCYRYSFAEEEAAKYESGEDWWLRRFGDDPLWGRGKKRK